MKEKFALLCAAFSLFAGCTGPIAESGGEPAQASPFTVAAAEPIRELQQMKTRATSSQDLAHAPISPSR